MLCELWTEGTKLININLSYSPSFLYYKLCEFKGTKLINIKLHYSPTFIYYILSELWTERAENWENFNIGIVILLLAVI